MKAGLFLVFAMLALVMGRVAAQTDASSPDPAKIAEYQARFQEGYGLEKAGKLEEARTIYDGIIAESPEAKRSLLEAGRISLQLQQPEKAEAYLEKLHAQVPDFPEATELLIQAAQALGQDVKVVRLCHELRELHDSGKIPEFTQSLYFVRERIHQDQSEILITQFFDFTKAPNTVWMAEIFDTKGQLLRRILLNYDPDATQALRQRDPKYASTEVFTWAEHKIKDQKVTELDAYLQIFALPDYLKFRSAMLSILANPPKPIYTQAIDASASGQ